MTITEIDQTDTAYCEVFEWPDGAAPGFVCSLCDRNVDDGPCPDHAPMSIPGLKLVDCTAETRHLMWVHDRDDYGTPCWLCMHLERAERDRLARQCRHWPWRRWAVTGWLGRWAYRLGIISGSCWQQGDGHDGCRTFSVDVRKSRPYVLGVSRDTWRCWLVGHHRRGEDVGLGGQCGKCVPWPCCGSQRMTHVAGCREDVGW